MHYPMESKAFRLGADFGASAASWYFDGNTSEETYRSALQGIEDGDPAVLDTFPTFAFGEWAGQSPAEVFDPEWQTMTDEEQDFATDEFLRGYDESVQDHIESAAREHLSK